MSEHDVASHLSLDAMEIVAQNLNWSADYSGLSEEEQAMCADGCGRTSPRTSGKGGRARPAAERGSDQRTAAEISAPRGRLWGDVAADEWRGGGSAARRREPGCGTSMAIGPTQMVMGVCLHGWPDCVRVRRL